MFVYSCCSVNEAQRMACWYSFPPLCESQMKSSGHDACFKNIYLLRHLTVPFQDSVYIFCWRSCSVCLLSWDKSVELAPWKLCTSSWYSSNSPQIAWAVFIYSFKDFHEQFYNQLLHSKFLKTITIIISLFLASLPCSLPTLPPVAIAFMTYFSTFRRT